MVHIAWDNGQKTSIALRRLRKDENDGRVDGALPIAFEISRSFDLSQKFNGPRLFVESVDAAVWTFYDSIARHLRAWQPELSRRELDESETHKKLTGTRESRCSRSQRTRGQGRVFDDGSIEIETAGGTKWYRSFTELERSLRAKDGLEPGQNSSSPSETGNGDPSNAATVQPDELPDRKPLSDPPVLRDPQ